MSRKLLLLYPSAGDFRAHLLEADARGVVLLPMAQGLDQWNAFDQADVEVTAGALRATMRVELVQVLTGAGLVVRVTDRSVDPSTIEAKSGPAAPPTVTVDDVPDRATSADGEYGDELAGDEGDAYFEDDTTIDEETSDGGERARPGTPAGSSAISWPIERLQAEWETLNTAERIRVARYGSRGARGVVMRGRDKSLLIHLLGNPNISTEEVAAIAGTGSIEPSGLRRIAANKEWLRSIEVTRNLVSNPKMPMPEVERLLRTMSRDELVRLAKSPRARAVVKQAAMKLLKSKAT